MKQLSEAGLKAEYLCSRDLSKREPDLLVDKDTAAAFLPHDCQLDAHRTVAYLEKVCILGLFFLGIITFINTSNLFHGDSLCRIKTIVDLLHGEKLSLKFRTKLYQLVLLF